MFIAETGKAVFEAMPEVRRTTLMREVELRFDEPIESLLHRLYITNNMTMRQVAQTIGVRSDSTVWLWLLKFGIPTRRWLLPEESARAEDHQSSAVQGV